MNAAWLGVLEASDAPAAKRWRRLRDRLETLWAEAQATGKSGYRVRDARLALAAQEAAAIVALIPLAERQAHWAAEIEAAADTAALVRLSVTVALLQADVDGSLAARIGERLAQARAA